MRLLKYVDGKFEPPEDLLKDKLPRYAILSHTWGADTEEVTFQDLREGTYANKSGYQKLLFCEQQARRDGIEYFWVDTCCIDKSSTPELSEALNSMFRWYQNADRCYVYLSDVSTSEDSKRGGTLFDSPSDLAPSEKKRDKGKQVLRKMLAFRPAGSSSKKSQPVCKIPVNPTNVEATRPWEDAFRTSRWFTRGWTLQELLAPRSVEFFSQDGQRLGDKRSLEQQIHEITGIDIPVLQGTPFTEYSVADRFKWAESRETTKEEDGVYCLLGIFDVFLPLIPGETKEHARRRLHQEIFRAEPKYKKGTKRVWMVPFDKNPSFTGRRSDLHNLRQALFVGDYTTKVALTGLGGMGKTQIALALAYETRDEKEDCSIIWIPSTTKESIGQAFRTAAQKFGIPGWNDDKADAMKLVQDHLSSETAGQWLLIIDNADDIDMWFGEDAANSQRLIDYLPKSRHGSILFTTRNKKAAVKFAPINIFDLSVMDDAGSEDLLRNYLHKKILLAESENATALLAYLNHLPLAIVQAARYINQNSIGLAKYLSLLNEQEEEVIELLSEDFEDEGRYPESKNPVATTWLVSFDQIRQRDPLAAEYLSFIACIDSKDIPLSILPPNPSAKKVTDAMGTLEGYSFITKSSTGLAISIHRLVHLATRNWLRKEKQLPSWTSQATDRLGDLLSDVDQTNRDSWRSYMPHAYYVIESATGTEDSSDLAYLLGWYAQCLKCEGRYNEEEKILQRQLEIRQTKLRKHHPDTLKSMNDLASTYRNQGRWDEAEKLDIQVLKTRRTVLGQDHPDTLTSMSNLAHTYWNQGRWDEAEKLEVQVLETRRTVLGQNHPDTLTSMSNLASTYWNQGRWDEAEKLERQVLETRRTVLGQNHPDTLTSMSNLASTYRYQGRWDEAEELEVQVLETSRMVLGQNHPHTLNSMHNLACTYRYQGRWDEAEKLQVQVLETRQTVLKQDHPDTLNSMHSLASTYWNQGRWDEAEKLQVQVLETRQTVLKQDHPDTLTSMNNLACTYWDQGRQEPALSLMKYCVEARKRVLGLKHPHTVRSIQRMKRWT